MNEKPGDRGSLSVQEEGKPQPEARKNPKDI